MAAGDYDPKQMKSVITDGVSQVTHTVQSALQSGDYSNLSRNVSAELEELFSNIGRTVSGPLPPGGARANHIPGYRNLSNGANWKNTQTYQRVHDINQDRLRQAQGVPRAVTPVMQGAASGKSVYYKDMNSSKTGALAGAIIGYSFFAFTVFPFIITVLGAIAGGAGVFATVFLMVLLGFIPAASLIGAIAGTAHLSRIKRFEKYLTVLQDKTYAAVKKLAAETGKDEETTAKDLMAMIRDGWFKQGHMDDDQETLITSNETYEQYLQTIRAAAEKAQIARQQQEQDGLTEEQRAIIRQGELYIQEIRECNVGIPDVDISAKLDRMENSVRVIVDRAKQKPELTVEMHRLMNYYLPTMVKLLRSYIDLDQQGKSSVNIEKSKKEIEDTIDVMNEAFDRLFDSLFEDTSLDIETDAEVIRTLLAQEGLTGHDFTSNANITEMIPGTGNQ
ncbi:MAG: 5-bromo-4-chloroindolyl phosphate hydrolysis family protein [Lachnospiraceae bacterium]|nr:5-bromo-4-chloroindolyl phosphate hydrolysis family protein [Lachnospiraceae bacterium]